MNARPPFHSLLVASRGKANVNGLVSAKAASAHWNVKGLDTVQQLSSLARHPSLPIVYGTASAEGRLYAWRIAADAAEPLGDISCGGEDPCHLAVHPSGQLLIATNYGTSNIAVVRLRADGSFDGTPSLLKLEGSSVDPERQEAAHPHQAVFVGDTLLVVDLGADLLREFAVDPAQPAATALTAARTTPLPAGTGPRHAVVLADGRVAISAELSARVFVGRLGDAAGWKSAPSTTRAGPAKTRTPRNYPGDIQASSDGRLVYLANRGHDTIATFDCTGETPVLVNEHDATVAWPQHLLVDSDRLLVAGWDSNLVVGMPLSNGVPSPAVRLFECSGAGWLLGWA